MRRLGNLSTYQDANHLYTRIATERTRKGLITNLFSPVERRKRDSALLIRPGLLQVLESHSLAQVGSVLASYDSPAHNLKDIGELQE